MKILIQSLLFIVVVALFAVTSDRLGKIEQKEAMNAPSTGESKLSDQEFLTQMIEHHNESIKVAKEILLPTQRQEIHELASTIIARQTKEIETMQQWKDEWYEK